LNCTQGTLGVKGYLIKTIVEGKYDAAVEANPYLAPQVLRWNGVMRYGYLHVTVTVDLASAIVIQGKRL